MIGLQIDVTDAPGQLRATVRGELDMHSAAELRAEVGAAIEARKGLRVVLDLSALEFVDSSGLSALIALHRAAGAAGGTLTLEHPAAAVRRMLQITGLTDVLAVTDNGAREGRA